MPPAPHTFGRLLAEAIAELSSTGYVSPERVNEWVVKLRNAAEREFGPMEPPLVGWMNWAAEGPARPQASPRAATRRPNVFI